MSVLSDSQIIGLCNRTSAALVSYDDIMVAIKFFPNELPIATKEENEEGYIRRSMRDPNKSMIEPFLETPVRYVDLEGNPLEVPFGEEPPEDVPHRKVISYGLSSFGYDVRLKGDVSQIKVFTNVFEPEIDPKNMTEHNFGTPDVRVAKDGSRYVSLPPHSYLQGPTTEFFRIPKDVLVLALGKSTYARSGLVVNVTPIEPEFEGEVVIEVGNLTSSPVRIYLDEGIAQFVFIQGTEKCRRSYKDKLGKYQGQRGLTLAKV